MPKASSSGFYAVRVGRAPGIYLNWADCEAQIKGFPGALFKKLSTEAQAHEFMTVVKSSVRCDAPPLASTSRSIPQDEHDSDIVYCDGACKGNGQPGAVAGIGVWWGHGDPRNISERCPGDQTNNRAELIAIVRILETTPRLTRRLLIKTDSIYSIHCVTEWIFKWMKNGFLSTDGKPIKNRALIQYLAALLHVRHKASQTIEFRHVRGHVGLEGNEAADQLANLGATKPMVPERHWEMLEKRALQSIEPVEPIHVVDDDLKAYADGLLDDDELAALSDASICDVTSPAGNATQSRAFVSPVHHLPPSVNVSASKLPSSSRGPQSAGSTEMSTISISKEELEENFAACLLRDDELATLGRDGVFDSDF